MSIIPFQHFILTRFNLRIWRQDKNGSAVRTREWLEDRFELFEKYCLPSIESQTCKDFEWIVLFDSKTPDVFRERIAAFVARCSQLIPVFVEPEEGRSFRKAFLSAVLQRLDGRRVITTYLDNDDALDIHFVEDLQRRAQDLADGTFVFYSSGYQYYTEFGMLLKIHYRRNHFVSVVEAGDPSTVQTIYGYGSHYYIDKIPGAKIEYVKNRPLWCEVIHPRNMGNDAYFLFRARMVRDDLTLQREFGIDEACRHGLELYLFRFLPRFVLVFFRRVGYFFRGRRW